jgi:1-deoxy-D-xylulose-5-phosphate reductoisomerase
MKKIAVFGSTGSIGTQTLSVAGFHPDEFEVYAIAANKNAEQVVRSANEFHPKFIGMYDEAAAREVAKRCPGITVVSGGEVNSLPKLTLL